MGSGDGAGRREEEEEEEEEEEGEDDIRGWKPQRRARLIDRSHGQLR